MQVSRRVSPVIQVHSSKQGSFADRVCPVCHQLRKINVDRDRLVDEQSELLIVSTGQFHGMVRHVGSWFPTMAALKTDQA